MTYQTHAQGPHWRRVALTAAQSGMLMMTMTGATVAPSIPPGLWGGLDVMLTVEAEQSRIEWSAADATIKGPIKLDAKNRFSTVAQYRRGVPGPQRIDTKPIVHNAQIEGQMIGDTINFTIRIAAKNMLRRYVVKKNVRPKLVRML